MTSTTPPPDREFVWRQYELHVTLYKEYLDLLLKFNVFFYAVTGAIVSYFLSKPDSPFLKYSLGLPVLMGLFFCGFFLYGANRSKISREEVRSLASALGFNVMPEYRVLTFALRICAALFLVIALGLLAVMLLATRLMPVQVPVP